MSRIQQKGRIKTINLANKRVANLSLGTMPVLSGDLQLDILENTLNEAPTMKKVSFFGII